MWIMIWKNVYDFWSPWPGPSGHFGALSESYTYVSSTQPEVFALVVRGIFRPSPHALVRPLLDRVQF